MFQNNPPKLGIVMTGASARSIFYIGFLESLKKHNIEIDYIVAYSGAAIVATAYACGNLEKLRDEILNMNTKKLYSLLKRGNKGGWYSLDLVEDYIRENYTQGKQLEHVSPRLCFLGADIITGELIEMSLGDIARAARVSCTMPGVFEPVEWGNRVLVDGGLVTLVPGSVARKAGMDIVVGLQVRSNRFFFGNDKFLSWLHKNIRRLDRYVGKNSFYYYLKSVVQRSDIVGYFTSVNLIRSVDARNTGMFSILGRCLDLVLESAEREKKSAPDYDCDLLIKIGSPSLFGGIKINEGKKLYEQGLKMGDTSAKKINDLKKKFQNEKIINSSTHDARSYT